MCLFQIFMRSDQFVSGLSQTGFDLVQLLKISCFHFDVEITADDVSVFTAGIVPYLNDICSAVSDDIGNIPQLTGLIQHGDLQLRHSAA